jgi:peptide/nickel transport system substrate-binding protein
VDAGGAALLIFNVASSPLNDVRVRRALAQGIDYARIVHDASRGTESTRNAPAGLFGATYDPSVKQLPFDVTRAKALLDEAGWRDGPGGVRSRDGVPLELDYAYDLQEAEGTDFGVLLQQAMRTLGVRLAMRGYSTQIFTAPAHIGGPLLGGKFEMSFVQLTGPTDPDLSWFFGCDQMPPNGFNISRFCDSQVSAADAASVASYDWNERRRQSIVIQRRLAEEVPLIALWQQGHVAVHIDSLIGVDPAPTSSVWNVGTWRIQHSGDAQGN